MFRRELIGCGLESLPEIGNETGVLGIRLGNGHHHAGIVFNLLRIDEACPDACLVKKIKKEETVVARRLHHAVMDCRVKLRDEPADAFSIIWEGLGTIAFHMGKSSYKSRFADVDAYVCHIIKSLVRNYIFCTLVANTGSDMPPQRTIQSLDVKAWGPNVDVGFCHRFICLVPCL